MATSEVVRIASFGAPSVIKLERLPVAEPGENELLLRVHAASVNPVDYKIREGKYPAVKSDKLPYVLGRDVSGTVEACGHGMTDWRPHDEVYAMLGIDRGAYAEHVIVKANEAARKPTSLDHTAAAAVPLAGLTAWQGLFRYGALQTRQRVLIHGGSGGVGHFAIQFAKARRAQVITTVSVKHAAFVRALGADQVIDYEKQRFDELVRDVDMVFDLIAGETQERSWRVLRKGGILVSTLAEPSQEKAREFGVRGIRYTVQESGSELREIADLIDAGLVKPKVNRTFGLREAAAAQEYVEHGHMEGKVVLQIAA
jgi:NADPH:quinone reductase-like Zn-dependent oxidoreductase